MFDDYRKFLRSRRWREFREDYINKRISIDGGLCEICGQVYGQELHHKIAVTPANISDEKIILGKDNVKWLCRECHSRNEKSRIEKYTNPPFAVSNGCYIDADGIMVRQKIYVVWERQARVNTTTYEAPKEIATLF